MPSGSLTQKYILKHTFARAFYADRTLKPKKSKAVCSKGPFEGVDSLLVSCAHNTLQPRVFGNGFTLLSASITTRHCDANKGKSQYKPREKGATLNSSLVHSLPSGLVERESQTAMEGRKGLYTIALKIYCDRSFATPPTPF